MKDISSAGLAIDRRDEPTERSGDSTLDAADLAILRVLVEDARISRRRLAQMVGMSAPAVADRLGRLERTGVVRAYRAEIDRGLLGYPLVVYVGVVTVQGADQSRVVMKLRSLPEVEDVQLVTGPKDLLVRLRLRDTAHLRECLFDRMWTMEGIERTETYISLGAMEPKGFDAELLDVIRTEREAIRVV
ncbi:MAG TPA: Lrp/AsnC family transcriptional regulator [Actinomycetota bacterium]